MNSVTIANKPLRQVSSVRELLVNSHARDQLAAVSAKHMNPERMMRVVANAIRTTPQIQEAEPLSMLGALMTCASLNLEPNTPLGHAYLIPFRNNRKNVTEIQLIIGYKGFADLARRSGQVVSLHADVVFDDDPEFSHAYGSRQHLHHVPGPRKGRMLGAYCHVRLRDGEGHVYMTGDEIEAIRNASQGWRTAVKFGKTKDSPWEAHKPRMWAKTALRRLANSGELPMSIEFLNAMTVDDAPADYRAFAMDPTGGIDAIPLGDDNPEPEEDEKPLIEHQQQAALPPTQERKREPVEKQHEQEAPRHRAASARTAAAPQRTEENITEQASAPEIDWQGHYNRIIANAMDGEPVDEIIERENDLLGRMNREAHTVWKTLMDELDAFRPVDPDQARLDV